MNPLPPPPGIQWLYDATVDIAPGRSLGAGPLGERRIVNILGGEFEGPGLNGRVLPGGADRQLTRGDGVRYLEALYEMETHDGAALTVRNSVKVIERPQARREAFSHVSISAPLGSYGWLNDAVLVGMLHPLRPAREAVLVRVFRLV